MKYEIYVERKIATAPFENITVGLTQQFDDETPPPKDRAFQEVAYEVEKFLGELVHIVVKLTPPQEKILISPEIRELRRRLK